MTERITPQWDSPTQPHKSAGARWRRDNFPPPLPRGPVKALILSPTAQTARHREQRRRQRSERLKDIGVAALCVLVAAVVYIMGRLDALGSLFGG